MAVLKCAKCGGEISSHAKKCPHCGVTKDEAIPQMTDCAECGKEFNLLTEDECPSCGAPKKIAASGVNAEQTEPRGIVMPVIAAVIFTAVVVAAIFYPREPEGDLTQRILDAIPSAEEGEFPTPESAVEHYVKCLKSGDVASMAKVLIIKEYVTHWDNKSNALHYGAVQIYSNMEYRHSKLLRALEHYSFFYDKMVWNMVKETDQHWNMTVALYGQNGELDEKGQEREYEKVFGPMRNPDLSGLEYKIGKFKGTDKEDYNRRNQIKWMEIYGADKYEQLELKLKWKGEEGSLMVILFKYGSNWKIRDISPWE